MSIEILKFVLEKENVALMDRRKSGRKMKLKKQSHAISKSVCPYFHNTIAYIQIYRSDLCGTQSNFHLDYLLFLQCRHGSSASSVHLSLGLCLCLGNLSPQNWIFIFEQEKVATARESLCLPKTAAQFVVNEAKEWYREKKFVYATYLSVYLCQASSVRSLATLT